MSKIQQHFIIVAFSSESPAWHRLGPNTISSQSRMRVRWQKAYVSASAAFRWQVTDLSSGYWSRRRQQPPCCALLTSKTVFDVVGCGILKLSNSPFPIMMTSHQNPTRELLPGFKLSKSAPSPTGDGTVNIYRHARLGFRIIVHGLLGTSIAFL